MGPRQGRTQAEARLGLQMVGMDARVGIGTSNRGRAHAQVTRTCASTKPSDRTGVMARYRRVQYSSIASRRAG